MSDRTLRDALLSSGAVVDGASALPLHFGAPRAELRAALRLCVLADRTTLGRVRASGPDLLDLLNRLSTADLSDLQPGDGCPTVITSAKGRIVERLFVHHLGEAGVLLVGGPGAASRTIEHLDRFTFQEQTGLEDQTATTCQLALSGPLSANALETAGLPRPAQYASAPASFEGAPVHVLGQDGYGGGGFSVVAPATMAGSLWQALFLAVGKLDGRPAGERAMEMRRILLGIPAPGHELTEDYNPLEAGLGEAVSFTKGCYVGQEVVARLNTYDKVSRRLVGLEFRADGAAPPVGASIFREQTEIGKVTSAALHPGERRPVGLGYVKQKLGGPGDEVRIGSADGAVVRLVELPFDID